MRTGIVSGVGAALILMEGAGWSMNRFTAAWWVAQVFQITAVMVGFLLVIRRLEKLEEETKSLRGRLNNIAAFCMNGLRLTNGEGAVGKGKERVLRSVS